MRALACGSSAASTCRPPGQRSMPAACVRISDVVRHGAQITGSDEPNITTTGTPNAAAMCAGPESLPTKSVAPRSNDFISWSGAPATVRYWRKGEDRRPARDEYRIEIQSSLQMTRHVQEAVGAARSCRVRRPPDVLPHIGRTARASANSLARGISDIGDAPDKTSPTPDVRPCEPCVRRPGSPALAGSGRCKQTACGSAQSPLANALRRARSGVALRCLHAGSGKAPDASRAIRPSLGREQMFRYRDYLRRPRESGLRRPPRGARSGR